MREIKFRAWDEATKEMWYPKDYPLAYHSEKFNSAELLQRYDNCMQYTGLKDKNGKEIYEGDLGYFDIAPNNLIEIKIEEGAVSYWSLFNMGHKFEVVGNIYERPNLLNSEQNPERSVATEDQSGNKT